MPNLGMRPRFAVDLDHDAELLVDVLREHVGDADPTLEGTFEPAHCVLRIPDERRSFWSPELDLTFEVREPHGVRVRCLFAPRPQVWTGFAFVYAALAAFAVISAIYGVAQVTLGHAPDAFRLTGGATLLIAGIYGATYIGRGLAANQMYEIRRYLDESFERAERRARRTPKTALDSARL